MHLEGRKDIAQNETLAGCFAPEHAHAVARGRQAGYRRDLDRIAAGQEMFDRELSLAVC